MMVSKRVNHELHRVPHSEVTYQTRNTVSEHISMHQVAYVASVPVRAERNNRAARRSFAFRTRGKWGESKKGEGGGWGRGKEGTLARRPLNSEKPVRPRTGHLIGAAWFI